jgi:hypothetical protein
MKPKLYHIRTNEQVEEIPPEDYGKLEYKCPSFSFMKERLGYSPIEHVTVLYQGKPAHMFVDEEFLLRDEEPEFNAKATRLYQNASLERYTHTDLFTYNDVNEPPGDVFMEGLNVILGDVMLWTGEIE